MNILGIDPSYQCTGIATAQWSESIRPPAHLAQLPPLARAARRRAALRGQLATHWRGKDVVAIEGMFKSLEYGVIDRAGLLATLTDYALGATEAAVLVVAPTSVKMYATGSGNADKPEMLTSARYHFTDGPTIANADEADSRWICALVHDLLGDPIVHLPATHRRALDAYRGPWTRKHPDPWVRAYDPVAAAARALGAR